MIWCVRKQVRLITTSPRANLKKEIILFFSKVSVPKESSGTGQRETTLQGTFVSLCGL